MVSSAAISGWLVYFTQYPEALNLYFTLSIFTLEFFAYQPEVSHHEKPFEYACNFAVSLRSSTL